MLSRSFVLNDDSTSICATSVSLDIRFAFDMALKCSICVAYMQRESLLVGQSTLVAAGNISNFEHSEKYIEFERSENISSCEATYRQKQGEKQMIENKNQLREDAIEFAIQISDLCDEIKGCSVFC